MKLLLFIVSFIMIFLADTRELSDGRALRIDLTRPSVRMWPEDTSHCGRILTHFSKDTNWGWLISYPRSGNTWTRYLLETATGIFTGSVYRDKELKEKQFLGEMENPYQNTSLIVKTHSLPRVKHRDKPAIMLIRNPARSIVSFWNWRKVTNRSLRHTSSVNDDTLQSPEFSKFASRQINRWEKSYTKRIKFNFPYLLPVYYELLRDDPIEHLKTMMRFLKVKIDEERLGCVANHLDGRVKGGQRTASPYTPEQRTRLKKAVENISNLLQDRGFPALPDYEKYES